MIFECKLVLKVFSFHMLPAWGKHQIVNKNIQGLSEYLYNRICNRISHSFRSDPVLEKFLNTNRTNFPVDTGRKLNVHKTLNVLCTFNLHPVSTGL